MIPDSKSNDIARKHTVNWYFLCVLWIWRAKKSIWDRELEEVVKWEQNLEKAGYE